MKIPQFLIASVSQHLHTNSEHKVSTEKYVGNILL